MSNEIHHKENGNRGTFYIKKKEKGIASELNYLLKDNGIMVINHTETKVAFEGQGLGSQLVENAVQHARENNLKIDPLCPFAEVKFDENKNYSDVRA